MAAYPRSWASRGFLAFDSEGLLSPDWNWRRAAGRGIGHAGRLHKGTSAAVERGDGRSAGDGAPISADAKYDSAGRVGIDPEPPQREIRCRFRRDSFRASLGVKRSGADGGAVHQHTAGTRVGEERRTGIGLAA